MNYQTTHVRFERRGDKVTPLRVTKQWVEQGGKRRFMPVRVSETGFPRPVPLAEDEDWRSTPPPVAATRESLKAAGLLREAGEGEPYLACGTPAEWSAAVANGPNPWEVAG